MTLEFGTTDPQELPVVPMAYVARAACGHVRGVVRDNGTAAAARDAGDLAGPGLVLERIPAADVAGAIGTCERCRAPQQRGLGL